MKEKKSIQGRSLIINILLVLLNITGFVFVIMGYHDHFKPMEGEGAELPFFTTDVIFKLVGFILMFMSAGGLFLFRGKLLMASVSRVLVGGLFIVSGLVKANDPLGFSYKLEEYFEDGALAYRIKELFGAPEFSLEFLMKFALPLSIIVCVVEIVLGVLVILGGKIKLSSYLLVGMMVFFTFLTWHTASCDKSVKFLDRDTYSYSNPENMALIEYKLSTAESNADLTIVSQNDQEIVVEEMKSPQCVDDCGCFGDALKGSVGRSLTPKESMWKDLILLYFVFWIFIAQWTIKPNNGKENMVYLATSLIVITFFSMVFGWYFPLAFGAVVLIGSMWILRVGGKFLGNFYGVMAFVILLCLMMTTYVTMYQPIKDYRPYHIGANLIENMNNGVPGEIESLLVYKNKNTGELKKFNGSSTAYIESKIWEDNNWEYSSMEDKVIVELVLPSIDSSQFNPMVDASRINNGDLKLEYLKKIYAENSTEFVQLSLNDQLYEIEKPNYKKEYYDSLGYKFVGVLEKLNLENSEISLRNEIVSNDMFVLVCARDLAKANWSHIKDLMEIQKECVAHKVPFAIVCSASAEEIEAFRNKYEIEVPILINDGIELKALARSNPAFLVVEKGVVTGKYPFRSTPTLKTFKNKYLK